MNSVPERPRRRRFALSVRALMILVLVVGGGVGWKANRARRQREAVKVLEIGNASTTRSYRRSGGRWDPDAEPWAPGWLRRWLGDEYFGEITEVCFGRDLTPEDVTALERLDNLEKIYVDDRAIGPAELTRLGRLAGLRDLDLFSCTGITDASLAGLARLEELGLFQTDVTDAGLAHLSGMTGLRKLDLRMTGVTDAGLAHLSGLTNLEELQLPDACGTDAGLAHLRDLRKLRVLTLGMSGGGVGDAGLAHLAGMPELRELAFVGRGVTDAGLAAVGGLGRLETLRMRSPVLATEGAYSVTEAGLSRLDGLAELRELDLHAMNLDDGWVAHLRGMKRLEKLNLFGQGLTDAGLAHLSGLTGIERLNLAGPGITDAGLAHLRPLAKLQGLTIVGRGGAAGLDAFKANRPALSFTSTLHWPGAEPAKGGSPGKPKLLPVPELPPPPFP